MATSTARPSDLDIHRSSPQSHQHRQARAQPAFHPEQYSQQQHEHEREQDDRFFSTTTEQLRDEREPGRAGTADRPNRVRASSAGSSILDRGRPTSRPSSFFGVDEDSKPHSYSPAGGYDSDRPRRPSEEWATGVAEASAAAGRRQSTEWATPLDDADSEQLQQNGSRSSYYAAATASNSADSALQHYPNEQPSSHTFPPGDDNDPDDQPQPRRSSFYGLDAIPMEQGASSSSQQPHRRFGHQARDSGSASYSSHDNQSAGARPRYSQAQYAQSHAGSLYGIPINQSPHLGSQGERSSSPHPQPAPLLDQSHLRPGALASLLSHEKTLELYRANAKKTNDPDVQFEFCTFVMEVVAELEQAQQSAGEAATAEGKAKQHALVSESVSLLNKLATRGHVPSQYFLADCYTQGIGTAKGKRDYDKALPLFILAGKHGHHDACFRAAQCFEHGWGTRRDPGKAVTLLRRASVLNHPAAMHRLGLAEINGELSLAKRPREGVKWLKRAAELADQVEPPQPQSLHELALLHEKGIENVVFKDEEYAAELLARASELQFAPSAYKLGECYEYGRMACPQDSALSIHYYNIAAQQSHREACFALTAWYLVGSPGVLPQSDTEAYLWAKKAAALELAKAEYAVGYFTEMGIGCLQDPREALEWFSKAAAHGDKRAQDRLRMAGRPGVFDRETMRQNEERRRREEEQSFPPKQQPKPSLGRTLRKKESAPEVKPPKQRGESIDGRKGVFSAKADKKGKGRQSAPGLGIRTTEENGMPLRPPPQAANPMERQRSASQPAPKTPNPVEQEHSMEAQQQQPYHPHYSAAPEVGQYFYPAPSQQLSPQANNDPYASTFAAYGPAPALPPTSNGPQSQPLQSNYGRPAPVVRQSSGRPEPKMPQRMGDSPKQAQKKGGMTIGEREKVLRKARGEGAKGDDKDCIIM